MPTAGTSYGATIERMYPSMDCAGRESLALDSLKDGGTSGILASHLLVVFDNLVGRQAVADGAAPMSRWLE